MFRLLDIVYDNCLFRQFKVNDLLFVEYKCLNDEEKLIVWSQHNFFIYILSGKKVWHTPQAIYEAAGGQAVFVKKGANLVRQFYDKEFCALIIFIPDQFIIDTIQHNDYSLTPSKKTRLPDPVILLEKDLSLSAYFQSVFSYFAQEQKPPSVLLELKFKELIIYILSSEKNKKLSSYFLSLCETNKSCIKEIMERNFLYNMKMKEFAELTGRSLASFKRDFFAIFKTTPGLWLMKRKLEYAKHLLEISDKNINEVSFDTGFESTSHFIRSFRQYYQVTPLQFKKRLTGNLPML